MWRPAKREDPGGPPKLDRRGALLAVADAVGGTFAQARVTGGYAVTVEYGPWTLTLDLHVISTGMATQMHTRVVTYFLSREDLKLTVRPRTFADRIAAKLGLDGTAAGGRDLARRYVVRGRPEPRVRSILGGGLAEALAARGPHRVEVRRAPRRHRKTMGPHARRLQVLVSGVDTDVERMTGMFALTREALDVLQRIGAASSEAKK